MNKMIFIAFSILLSIASAKKYANITGVSTSYVWTAAEEYCSIFSGSWENKISLYSENGYNGKYEHLSHWAYIVGCYDIKAATAVWKIKDGDHFECEMRCENSQYFAMQKTKCFCIDNVFLLSKTCKCISMSCLTVWKHYSNQSNEPGSMEELCIAATEYKTNFLEMVRKEESYNTSCGDGIDIGYRYVGKKAGTAECKEYVAFIKWYDDKYCQESTSKNQQELCFDGSSYRCFGIDPEDKSFNCEFEYKLRKHYSFFCETMDDEDLKPAITVTRKLRTTGPTVSTAVGTVAVFVFIAVIIYRRRINKINKNNRYINKTTNNRHPGLKISK